MTTTKSPFYYGGVVSDEHFCNRAEEMRELIADIDTGLNVLLYAPRRFGKTSLVLNSLRRTTHTYVFMDLMGIVDTQEFINEYFNALSKTLASTADKAVNLFKKILGLRPNIAVDFDAEGKPSFRLGFLGDESKNVLKEVLELPFKFATHHNQKVVIVFDEFQEAFNLGITDKMRSVIQHHGDKVSYVFMGSKKSIMKKMFFDRNKPFYKSVKHLPIDKISDENWQQYIMKGFTSHHKHIDEKSIELILSVSKGFPYYTQQIANELFGMTEVNAGPAMVHTAIDSILDKEEDLFLSEWERLSQRQKKALKLLIYATGRNIYAKETITRFNFTSSALKKAVEGLIAKDVIDQKGGAYYFQDPLFEFWLKRFA